MGKRGQSTVEFLMTYGWAIVLVLLAIAVLAYFGVLNPASYLPEVCIISPGFSCDEFRLSSNGSAVLVIKNSGNAEVSGIGLIVGDTVGACTPANSLAVGESSRCVTNVIPGIADSKFTETLTFVYTEARSTLAHKKIGKLVLKYE